VTALVLHWPLDAVTPQSQALDVSPNKINGVVEGDPANVADPKVGSCLELDGVDDAVTTAETPEIQEYTIEAWVRPADIPRGDTTGLFGTTDQNHQVVLLADGTVEHRFATSQRPDEAHRTDPGALPDGQWRHVAVTNDGRVARIYLDGVEASAHPFTGGRLPHQSPLLVGQGGGPGTYLPGRLAHLRVYDGALTPAEIKRDIADDEAALESFVRTHPLGFSFVNSDLQPVLFIDDSPGGQQMTLQITNTSRREVEALPLPAGAASPSAYHFALRFRLGTLPAGLDLRVVDPGWSLLSEPDGTAVYLTWAAPGRIAPGTSVTLRIDGMNADGAAGTRGTRVELDYRNVRYTGEATELTGTRMQFLDVVNHRGRRDIPLDLRPVGGDRVLSDGSTAGSLVLHLTNVLRDGPGIPLRGADVQAASSFTVSFDVQQPGEERPWALTTTKQAEAATLAAPDGWRVEKRQLGQRVQWTLTPTADTELAPGAFLALALDEIYGLPQAGHAPIVVEYRNIPGYADGTLTVQVERAPLLFTADRVGIGTATPGGGLHIFSPDEDANGKSGLVIGRLSPGGLRLGRHKDYAWIQSDGPGPLSLNPAHGSVAVGVPTAQPEVRLTVGAEKSHLQLRRESSHGPGGRVLYLELYQDRTSGPAGTYPCIRFHDSHKFWHRIEGRPEGFQFRTGNLDIDDPVDIYAAQVNATGLKIGGVAIGEHELGTLHDLAAGRLGSVTAAGLRIGAVTIGEHELRVLQRLAAGQLEFDLYNVKQGEYIYAADYDPYDDDRRRVFTWRRKERINQGRWRIHYPS
jgi:hypothetical protein